MRNFFIAASVERNPERREHLSVHDPKPSLFEYMLIATPIVLSMTLAPAGVWLGYQIGGLWWAIGGAALGVLLASLFTLVAYLGVYVFK